MIDTNNKLLDKDYKIVITDVKVLVVDDNMVNLKVEKGLLEKYNMRVDLAESGEECIEKIRRYKYDAIFMDQMMPDLDGIETFEQIKKIYTFNKDTPVILVTANTTAGHREKMLEIGFDGYVLKPIIEQDLIDALIKVLPSRKVEIKVDEANTSKIESLEITDSKLALELAKIGVDAKIGIKYCGDMEFYREVLKISYETSIDKIASTEKFFREKDYKNYTIVVHSVKSSAANIGAMELSQAAKELEMAGKSDDYAFIEANNDAMLNMYKEVMAEIAILLGIKSLEEETEDVVGDKSISSERWDDMIDEIKYNITELELDAAEEIVDEMLSCKVTANARILLGEIKEKLQVFDVEGAKTSLDSLTGLEALL